MAGTLGDLPIKIQDRDLAVLRGFFESRLMNLAHVSTLYFNGHEEYAKKRLQKLKGAGLVAERRRRPFEPSILFLTHDGYRVLQDQEALYGYPQLAARAFARRIEISELTLRHELRVMDVKAAFTGALRTSANLTLSEFTTWPVLYAFKAFRPDGRLVLIKPDGFIRVREQTPEQDFEHSFFVEVDCSTEVLETLVLKVACYTDYYIRGGFARRCGLDAADFKQAPFRVLMVFKSIDRRNSVAAAILASDLPLRNLIWLTTMAELSLAPLASIWTCPTDSRSGHTDAPLMRHALFE